MRLLAVPILVLAAVRGARCEPDTVRPAPAAPAAPSSTSRPAVAAAGAVRPAPTPPAPHRMPPEHDLLSYGVVLEPDGRGLTERRDIPYATVGSGADAVSLVLDIVLPPGAASGKPPVVIFINGVGDAPGQRPLRDWGSYRSWARLAGASGIAGVTFAARAGDTNAADITAAFRYVHDHASELGVDGARIAAWACSANVRSVLPLLMNRALPDLRGAVLYYGNGDETLPIRTDLPVLCVRAGRDRPEINDSLGRMAGAALSANAPWTVMNVPGGHHAFDVLDATDESRSAIRETIQFLQARLGVPVHPPAEQARKDPGSVSPPPLARSAMAHFFGREYEASATDYRSWLASHPDDGDAWTLLANALVELRRFDEARPALARAAELLPDVGEPVAMLGRLEADARNTAAAEPLLRRAIALMPLDGESRFQLGKLLLADKRNDEAAAMLQEAVQLAPGNGYAWSSLAAARYALKQYAPSAEAYRRVLTYAPNNPTLLYNLACVLALDGRTTEALDALDRAVTNGFRDASLLASDPDMASLRTHPSYAAIVERARNNPPVGAPTGGSSPSPPGAAPPPPPPPSATSGSGSAS